MPSRLNEEIMKTNLDIPDGEIKIDGAVSPVYADALNVHKKKEKEIEKALKDKKPELKKPFTGTKGNTTIMPKTKEMKKLKLSEDLFKPARLKEHYDDCPDAYQGIFRVLDNMEHIINYISELTDEELTYEDMKQSYDVLEEAMLEFADYLDEIQSAESANESLKEDTAVLERPATKKRGGKGRASVADIWDRIYCELNGDIKGIEATNRQLQVKPRDRYSDGDLKFRDSTIIVQGNSHDDLAFGRRVANIYGVQTEVKEHTSRYAPYRYELLIHTDSPVANEEVEEKELNIEDKTAVNEDLKIYRESDLSDFEFWSGARDTVKYLTEDEVLQIGRMLEEIYPDGCTETDINDFFWFEDDTIAEWLGYESFEDIMNRDTVDEGLTKAQRHNRMMDSMFDDKKSRDVRMSKFLKDNSDITDDELKKVQDGDKVGLELKNRGLHDRYWDEIEGKNESLKESYVEVDTITCGEESYRVVGGGFDTRDALVSVEDEQGNQKRLSSGDVSEFYTWLDREGNVIHEPLDDDMEYWEG